MMRFSSVSVSPSMASLGWCQHCQLWHHHQWHHTTYCDIELIASQRLFWTTCHTSCPPFFCLRMRTKWLHSLSDTYSAMFRVPCSVSSLIVMSQWWRVPCRGSLWCHSGGAFRVPCSVFCVIAHCDVTVVACYEFRVFAHCDVTVVARSVFSVLCSVFCVFAHCDVTVVTRSAFHVVAHCDVTVVACSVFRVPCRRPLWCQIGGDENTGWRTWVWFRKSQSASCYSATNFTR